MELFHESFEDGEWSHKCRVFPASGEPFDTEIGNIFVPAPDWTFWFKHQPGTWDQPEGHHCWKAGDARRIHSGDGAYQYFWFWRHGDGGLMRQVQVEPGTNLRFTAWAHAWSNHSLEGHEACCDDGRCSCGVGREVVAIPVRELPEPSGTPWEDAVGNSVFMIGIDPTGGTGPFADTVEWGESYVIYNGYAHQLEAKAMAQSNVVTVFLRNITKWGFKHNDAYWDDAKLEAAESSPEGRGQPRVQYERIYVLLPPDAGKEWPLAVINATWADRRYTLGGSADDAGVGDLDTRRVIAVNPDGWGPGLEEWCAEHEPDVEYIPVEADSPESLRQVLVSDKEDIALSQRDPRWANKDMGEDPGGDTIADVGCLLTSFAMCLRHAGHPTYPDDLNLILAANGAPFTDDDHMTNWAAAVGLFDVFDDSHKSNEQYSAVMLETLLVSGWEIVLRRADAGHFVYLEYVDGETLHIIDPWDGQRKIRVASRYAGIRAARRTGSVPPLPPTPPPDFPLRGVHDLVGADWLLENKLEGWCTVARYLGTDPQQLNLKKYKDAGIRVILRLTYSYAQDDGGAGTMPPPDKLQAHEDAVVETMRLNPSAWGFIYGNEPNNKREWPHSYPLTPAYYLASYNRVWANKPLGAYLSPCAIDPYNAGWGDWRKSWLGVLRQITGANFIALHAYTHGPDPALIWGKREFSDAPLIGVYYDMRVLESQTDIIPARFGQLLVVVTETNHWVKKDGTVGWEPDADEWVIEALKYFRDHGVAGVCLFRHGYKDWNYGGLPRILEALK